MRDPRFRRQQEDNLRAPHVAPINALVDELIKTAGRGWVPYVSPLYGGVNARVLNIHRDPGPKTHDQQGGSSWRQEPSRCGSSSGSCLACGW